MKLAFFTQNTKQGGLDTFIVNLITHWPVDDEIVLFCNSSHPGFAALQKNLAGKAKVIAYDFWIAQDISVRLADIPSALRMLFRGVFWLLGFPYLVIKTEQLLKKSGANRLMIINGGYPGGDACLAATLGWWLCGRGPRAWHNFHNLVLPYPHQPLRRAKEKIIDRFVTRASAGFVTVSRACMVTLKKRSQLAASRQTFIYNGIAPFSARSEPRLKRELGIPATARLILMLAVYEPRKGHAMMIRSMEEVVRCVPEAVLVICGDGNRSEIDEVQHLCASSTVAEKIFLQGHRRDIDNLLSSADVLVLPSQGQESFGYAAVEAMAVSCPVVVTDVGGLPEVVDDGGSGYVISHSDQHALTERIVSLLLNEELRKQMGAAGEQRYQQKFAATRMAAEYFSLIEKS